MLGVARGFFLAPRLIDFETRSRVPIEYGVYKYAKDPSTTVLCMAWKLPGRTIEVWKPGHVAPKASCRLGK